MIHDKFCPMAVRLAPTFVCLCDDIANVRADERERMAGMLQAKGCEDRNCGHTACVVYFNAGRILQGVSA